LGLMLLSQLPSLSQEIAIEFQPAFGRPYVQSGQIMVDAAEYNTLVLAIEAKQKGTARLFWMNHYNMVFNQPKSLWFTIRPGKHQYYFNFPSQNMNWIGWVRGLLINPDFPGSQFKVIEAKAIKGNLITNIKSAWQEFWGPNGRVEIGSTVHVIPSSSIFGRSINVYIYWLTGICLALIFALAFVKEIRKSKNYLKTLNLSLNEAANKSFVLIIISWLFLSLNSDYNYFSWFKHNNAKYLGKTMREKRIAAYGQELIEYLDFVREKLPQEPVLYNISTNYYAFEHKARILLYPPHQSVEDPNDKFPPYTLVFYPKADYAYDTEKYVIFAKMDENKYILKRKY
jgi:hypothetical protein